MAYQASRGIEYLHEKKCIHRDLATRNCLLSGQTLKLADFGMCRATLVYKIDLSKPQNVRWLAPEVWRTGETRFCTDIYAFGITLWELFEIPYNSPYCTWKAYTVKEKASSLLRNDTFAYLRYRLPSPEDMPDPVVTLMRKCWDQDPKRRPTATDVRKELEQINRSFNEDDSQTARNYIGEEPPYRKHSGSGKSQSPKGKSKDAAVMRSILPKGTQPIQIPQLSKGNCTDESGEGST
ncbi:unnamed protein product [Toxocara canis]|uniref:Protein kinase domain-containing protein n=1 Tax=Toxocara canis TaxID=6265 RepID=A0A183UKS1_TOXCA|nr:unnamed protein product [Toxocara canis]